MMLYLSIIKINMNYKIRITAENQAIVKRIADENGMNKTYWEFDFLNVFYSIKNNQFTFCDDDYPELTTEQFIEMFDKNETLEEAAERLWLDSTSQLTSKNSFIQGAKWQAERGYSEEDMEEYADFCSDIVLREQIGYPFPTPKQWFEQFKIK